MKMTKPKITIAATMTNIEFRQALAQLSWTVSGAARALGCTTRTAQHWAAGTHPVPALVARSLQDWMKTGAPKDLDAVGKDLRRRLED